MSDTCVLCEEAIAPEQHTGTQAGPMHRSCHAEDAAKKSAAAKAEAIYEAERDELKAQGERVNAEIAERENALSVKVRDELASADTMEAQVIGPNDVAEVPR